MKSAMLTLLMVATMIIGAAYGGGTEHRRGNWQVRKLDKEPAWYEPALNAYDQHTTERLGDSVTRYEYLLKDGTRVVQYFRNISDGPEGGDIGWIAPGSIYRYGADTVLLDSNQLGFSLLSFADDSTRFVAGRIQILGELEHASAITIFDLNSHTTTVLQPWVDDCGPKFDRSGGFVAYTDVADLFIFNTYIMSAELVFQRGGTYASDGESDHRIGGLRWSPNGDSSLVFRYYYNDDMGSDKHVLYEVRWSPWTELIDSADN